MNANAKLTEDDVRTIRRIFEETRDQYRSKCAAMRALAKDYNCSTQNIEAIIARTRWEHVV